MTPDWCRLAIMCRVAVVLAAINVGMTLERLINGL